MLDEIRKALALPRHVAVAVAVLVLSFALASIGDADAGVGLGVRVAIAASLGAAVGALLGVVQAFAVGAFVAAARWLGLDTWWAQANTRDPAAPRGPNIALRAGLCAGLAMIPMVGVAVWISMPRLLEIADPKFARSFAVVLLLGVVAGALVGGLVLARVFALALAQLDSRLTLPWPPSPVLRYALLVVAPVCAVLPWYLLTHADALGAFALPFWLLVVLVVEGLLALIWAALRDAEGPPSRLVLVAALVVALAGAITAHALMARNPAAARWARSDPAVGVGAALVSSLTDVDRDGYSSLFGGGDCAAFDASISPKAHDEPQNGIDEDCSGEDAALREGESLEVFYGAYTPPEGPRPNVIFVIADAIRADHTGFAGQVKRSPTPYLDEAAEDSLVFTRAYAQSSTTMMSIPSMLAGRDPSKVEWSRGERIEFAPTEPTLGTRLSALGYQSMLIGESYFKNTMTRLHDEFDETDFIRTQPKARRKGPGGGYFSGRAVHGVVEIIRYLERASQADAPAFVTLYIPDPHSRYDRHGFGISRFGKGDQAVYKGEIANVDRGLGFLIHYLKHTEQWDNTILIVVSDHGEEFQEHGGEEHSRTCYGESVHVPLLIHAPGLAAQVVDTPVALMDIAPTVLELVGASDDATGLDGQSLLMPMLAPERAPARTIPCAVISQRARQGNFFRRAARTRDGVLVHNVIAATYEYYETGADPGEQTNLYAEREADPEVVRLRAWLGESLTGSLPRTLITD